MAPKKAVEAGKRKKEVILLEVKKEIIRKHERGMRLTDLAREYGKSASTIATIVKMKEKITGRDAAKGVSMVSKQRPPVMEEVEKLLLLWIQEKQRAGDVVSEPLICQKAKALHADLLDRQPGTSADAEGFKASRGWFDRFKSRSGIHSVARHGGGTTSDVVAAEGFVPGFLGEFMASEGYLPWQVSHRNETGLFWKKTPKRTFVTEGEALWPGHRPVSDCRAEGHDRDLTTEDLVELQKAAMEERVSFEEETREENLPSREPEEAPQIDGGAMAPKKAVEAGKRTKEMILLEVKKEIIRKHERGMRLTDLAKEYGKKTSTIATIVKMKEKITGRDAAKGVTKVSKQRPPVLEEVEKLLLLWIQEKQRAGDVVTEPLICQKAKALHADLLGRQPGTSADAEGFKASRGWFDRFKSRSGIHSVARHGGATSSDAAAAEAFVPGFMASEGYLPWQVPNRNEAGLFRKRTPKRTFVTEGEALLPGHEPVNDYLACQVERRNRELTTEDLVELQKAAMKEQVSVEEEEEEAREENLPSREPEEAPQIDCGVVAAPKKTAEAGKRKKRILLEVKKEIIRKHNRGMRLTDLAKEYGKKTSTIATILKMKEKIMGRDAAKGVSIVSKQRPPVLEEVEKLLLLWIQEKQRAGDVVTELLICQKAKALHDDLLGRQPGTSADGPGFKASRGWFDRFKSRSGIHSVVSHGGGVTSNAASAKEFVTGFLEFMASEDYLPWQVSNRNETGLFPKRTPKRTFVPEEESSLSGHRPVKRRLNRRVRGRNCEVTPSDVVELQKKVMETSEGPLSSRELQEACQNDGGVAAPKKAAEAGKRTKEVILLEVKKEIIRKHDGGMRLTDLAKEYGKKTSTIATILKMKEKIMGRDAAKGVTKVSKQRPPVLEEVEKLLLLWIKEKQRAGEAVTEPLICQKAKALHAYLLDRQPGTSGEAEGFKASRGWFDRFKSRSGIHSVARHGGGATSDVAAAEEFVTGFLEEVMASEGYVPQQVFNCDETELSRKKRPKRTFVTEGAASLSGHKLVKGLLTRRAGGHDRELTTEDLVKLQKKAMKQRVSVEEEETREERLSSKKLKKAPQIDGGVTAPKKTVEARKRKKKMILLKVKKEIIRKHERGMRLTDLAKEYGRQTSTIASILKMKEKITGRDAAKGVTKVSKQRPPILEVVEKLLLLWIQEKQRAGDSVTEPLICQKAKALHADLLDRQPGTSANAEGFKASRGWFDRFRSRSGIHCVVRRGEAASSDASAAEEFVPGFLEEVMASEGYVPHTDNTRLSRKRAPKSMRIFVTDEETLLPGHEPAKDPLALRVEGLSRELTTDDLVELQKKVMETSEEHLSSRELEEACQTWVQLQAFVQHHHPEKALAQRLGDSFDTDIMSPFRGMLEKRQRPQATESFLLEQPRHEEEEAACVSPAQLPSSSETG